MFSYSKPTYLLTHELLRYYGSVRMTFLTGTLRDMLFWDSDWSVLTRGWSLKDAAEALFLDDVANSGRP